jgi:hypothetical protein
MLLRNATPLVLAKLNSHFVQSRCRKGNLHTHSFWSSFPRIVTLFVVEVISTRREQLFKADGHRPRLTAQIARRGWRALEHLRRPQPGNEVSYR